MNKKERFDRGVTELLDVLEVKRTFNGMTNGIRFDTAIPCSEVSDIRALSIMPMLSVILITYNHELWIRRAIESVITQYCEFSLELIVAEDASSDTTREICLELQQQYPQHIRVLYSEENIGGQANFLRALKCARGKYITFLEGDDRWTVDAKINERITFLEKNLDVAMAVGNTRIIKLNANGEEAVVGYAVANSPTLVSLAYIVARQQYHTSTMLIRKTLADKICTAWLPRRWYDFVTLCIAASENPIYYIDAVVSERLATGKGIYSSLDAINKYAFDIEIVGELGVFMYPMCYQQFYNRLFVRGLSLVKALPSSNKQTLKLFKFLSIMARMNKWHCLKSIGKNWKWFLYYSIGR